MADRQTRLNNAHAAVDSAKEALEKAYVRGVGVHAALREYERAVTNQKIVEAQA